MSANEMGSWDAVETAERVRTGDVSRREVVDAAIERAKAARHLGALVTDTFQRARRGAAGRSGPLAGVPTFIKDLAQVRGVATSWGTAAAGTYVSRKSDPFVERFEATGVACLGKSASPELGLSATTEPSSQVPCRNPWAPMHSSGGSSGGAGALVAAGVVPLAHGSDGGGSIRIPASCCGLVGLKVSRHRMDMEGSPLLPVNLAADGCLTRTVRDTVAFWQALESGRPSRHVAPIGKVTPGPGRPLRIGVFVTSPTGLPVHADNRDAVVAAARLCETLGHHVEEIPCPFDGAVIEDFLLFYGFVAWVQIFAGKLLTHWGFDRSKLEPWTRGIARYSTSQPRAVAESVWRLHRFQRKYAEVTGRYDVLICPTTASPPPELGHLAPDLPFETSFERAREYVPFTPIQNVAGTPAISLPLGRSAGGLPIGVQLAAPWGKDWTLLELALSLEVAEPWQPAAPSELWAQS